MAQNKTWWQKYRKDVLLALAVIAAVAVAVLGWHWTDTANRTFWSTFWAAAAVVCLVGLLGGWVYLWNKDRKK